MKQRKRANKSAFEKWWLESRNGPHLGDFTPYEVARIAFQAGRKSVPSTPKLKRAAENLLDMLSDFDAGFDGFGEVNEVEKLLGRQPTNAR